jgi:DNA-binding LytR/AlgR family response regulator
LHVAICDDNVADRKHIERLLSRESDKRAGTPNILYIDSYGDKDKFLVNPLMYNIIFMDMCSRSGLVEEIIAKLEEMEYNAPLVLYSSKIDYTQIPNLPSYVIHEKKPYIPEPLPELLKLGDINVTGHVEIVELHANGILHDIPKNDIMYAEPADSGNGTKITFHSGQTLTIEEDLGELRRKLEHYEEFVMVNKKAIANFKLVTAVMFTSIVMQDYKQFNISPLRYKEYKNHKKEMDGLF